MQHWLNRKRIGAVATLLLICGAGIWLLQRQLEQKSIAARAVENRSIPQITGPETILVSGDWQYPPYEFINEDGEPDGFNIELIREVAKVTNLQVDIRLVPWVEARQMLKDGDVDVLAGMYYSEQRNQEFDFSLPHNQVRGALFVPQNSSIQTLEDIPGKRIAVQDGDILHDFLLTLNTAGEIVPVPDAITALRGVASGDYDGALLSSMLQGLFYLDQEHISTVRLVEINQPLRPYAFAVANGNSNLLFILNEGLDILKATGKYQEIHERWFGIYEARTVWYSARYLGIVLGGLGLLLGAAVIWTRSLQLQVRAKTKDLKKSEEKYRLLVENATEGVIVTVADEIVFTNQRSAEILDTKKEQLISTKYQSWIHPQDIGLVNQNREAQLNGDDSAGHYPVRVVTPGGEIRWIFVHPVWIEWEDQPAILDLMSDITDVKVAEEQIKRQFDQLAALRSVDLAITASLDLSVTLSILLEQVVTQLGVDAADALLFDPVTHQVNQVASYGLLHRLPDGRPIHTSQNIPGSTLLNRVASIDLDLHEVRDQVPGSKDLLEEGFCSYSCIPLVAKNSVQGVLEIFNRNPLPKQEDWRRFLDTLAGQAAIAIDSATMYQDLQRANDSLILAYDTTIEGWARALELRDQETEGHSQRVASLTVELALRMGFKDEEITHIRRGALLHDIGKMGIPDEILLKPGKLTEEEWVVMRKHPVYAQQLLSHVRFLRPAMAIPYSHHERWDGSGYPLGLKGDQIPLAARIFAVIDIWDALSNDRPYRAAWPEDKVVAYLVEESGRLLDPAVVENFLAMRSQWGQIIQVRAVREI